MAAKKRTRIDPIGPARPAQSPAQHPGTTGASSPGARAHAANGDGHAAAMDRRPRRGPTRGLETRPSPGDSPTQEIDLDQIDPHALEVTRRLRRAGYKAYLVGGCVRDLLLGLQPKDFDVATSARPEEVKALFRNSRIIGRRFRLVHVFFRGGKIIETATFRAMVAPGEEEGETPDLLIRRDNVFGSEEEDAQRRDFTINGLFYDVGTGRIIDHVGGLPDVERRLLRMIGDPEIRLREDPVRILRAIRIASKAGLTIEPSLLRAMTRHKQDISRCAPARVLEETLRLLRIGHAEKTVRMMVDSGILEFLLPELHAYLEWPRTQEDVVHPEADDEPLPPRPFPEKTSAELLFAHLRALDEAIARGPVSDAVVLGALIYAAIFDLESEAERMGRDKNRAVSEFLATIGARLTVTRRLSEHLRQIFTAQRHFRRSGEGQRRRRRSSASALSRRGFYPDALALYEIHVAATGGVSAPALEDARPDRNARGDEDARPARNARGDEDEDPGRDEAAGDEGSTTVGRRSRRRRGGRRRRPQAEA